MNRQTVAIALILLSTALLALSISCEEPCPSAVADYDGLLPPLRFMFDSAERCQLDSSFPGFVVRDSLHDGSGHLWEVCGYFFCFDRDFYLEVFGKEWGGHRGDIEGAWILSNPKKGIVVTALSAHSYLQVRTNPRLGEKGYLDLFVERGKHGLHYEVGIHWSSIVPYMANGEGQSFTVQWFDTMPVYSGNDGAQALKEKFFSALKLGGEPRTLRAEPIIHSLENDAFYLSILDAALAGKEKVSIRSLLTKGEVDR